MSEVQHIEDVQPCSEQTAKASRRRPRDANFDFLKGVLVLVMVAHHSLGYFKGPAYPLIKYLDFVTGGFVFASGFLAALLIQSRIQYSSIKTGVRLLQRAAKLILLFVVINAALGLAISRDAKGKSFGVAQFFSNLDIVLGTGEKSLAAFPILLPIAYTILALGILVIVGQVQILAVGLALSLLVYCMWDPLAPFNLYFLTVGMTGVALGTLFHRGLLVTARRQVFRMILLALAITYWIAISFLPKDNAVIYNVGLACVLASVYLFADFIQQWPGLYKHCILLGQYSLLAYLAQILFLQTLRHFGPRSLLGWGNAVLPFLLAIAFLTSLCFSLDYLRRHDQTVNACYRVIFS